MKDYRGYLIDLDGTMYLGEQRIDAAGRFIERLQQAGKDYLFVTNNSTRTPEQVAEKLIRLGVKAAPADVFTTSMATAAYIHQRKPNARVYAIGEQGLIEALRKKGLELTDHDCDYVVIGLDKQLSYEKLAKACLLVRSGAVFVSTNSDLALPTEAGLMPGNGAITSVISASTGVDPIFIGKPEAEMMEQALQELKLSKSEVIMVGDNYNTDIMAGIRSNLDTLMVFTGFTAKTEFEDLSPKPTYALDSLDEWEIN